MADYLTKSVFTEQSCVGKLLSIANRIACSVTQEITEAVNK
jgi:hypothetical protein